MNVGRLITAMVTPFTPEGELDVKRARALALRLVDQGSEGIVVTGTTGESPVLSAEEKAALWETVVDAVADRALVWAGTGTYDTKASVALSRRAQALGVHGLLLVTPYYNKPSQEGLYRHFRAIVEEVGLPAILYNVPSRTGVNLEAETTVRLAREFSQIVAVKEASGNLDQVGDILRARPSGFSVLSGDDKFTLPMLALGAEGVVSVASHVVGPQIAQMITAFAAGNVQQAWSIHLRLLPLFRGLFMAPNPVPVKHALRLTGFDVGGVRPPLAPLGGEEEARLVAILREIQLV
jgi:4-hydroxy-tetrahydrodipicolinate synthase